MQTQRIVPAYPIPAGGAHLGHSGTLEVCAHCGARIHDEEGQPHPEIAATRALTEREIEVLKLAAAGLTNKEIAKAIGFTEATAKVHLKWAFLKLDIRHRSQLPSIMGPQGVFGRPYVMPDTQQVRLLDLIAQGMSDKEIARRLLLTQATVKSRLKQIKKAAGVRNRTQLASWHLVGSGLAKAVS